MLIKIITAATLTLGTMACASAEPAPAHGWRLNPALCPDLREDRRDRAVTYSRRDRREDRRDSRVTSCPARAWTYVGPYPGAAARPPVYSSIYIGHNGAYYGVRNGRSIRIRIVDAR